MIGTTVATYRIVEKVGQGGMGTVYRAVDLMLEREVAVKILNRELSGEPRIVERFRSEAVTLARLNHPNIAMLYSLFVEHGDLFMVMEFLRGEPLETRIKRAGALSLTDGVAVVCQALEGVHHAHEAGIIHRDLKPSNLMIMNSGVVKVMDFGIARALGAARLTREGRLVGTIEYMSPEQIKGCEADRRSDLYSMGVVLYECLTGQLPFSATSEFELMRAHVELPPIPPRSLNPELPSELEAILMRSLAKDPAQRFSSAADFHQALLPILEGSARLAGRPTTGDLARQILAASQAVPRSGATGQASPASLDHETRLADEHPTAGRAELYARETRLSEAPKSGDGRDVPLTLVIRELFSRLGWKHYAAAVIVLALSVWPVWLASDRDDDKPKQGQQPATQQETTPATGGVQTLPSPPSKAAAPIDYDNLPGVIRPAETETPEPPPVEKKAAVVTKKPQPSAAQPATQGRRASAGPAPAAPPQPTAEQGRESAGDTTTQAPPATNVAPPADKAGEGTKTPTKEDARSLLRRHLGKDKKDK
jgi:serine/threonine protein kinase